MLIAQLSDLHIKAKGKYAYQKVDTLSALEQAVDSLNEFSPNIDAVVITGDLGDFGSLEEYQLIGKSLKKLSMPIYLVPGNHDKRKHLRQSLSSLIQFAHEYYCTFYFVSEHYVWIGLDSLVEGKPYGYIDSIQLDWLEQQLKKQPDSPHILCWHHPPLAVGLGHMDVQNLQNAHEVAAVLRNYPQVKGIICGHLHRAITAIWQGIPVWVAPAHNHSVTLDLNKGAPSSFTIEPPMIRLFGSIEGQFISHLHHISNTDGPHSFFDQNNRLID